MEVIRLFDRPHLEARRLIASGASVYLHVNPIEYHGPHLSLHNDRLLSEALGKRLHAKLWPDLPLLHAGNLEVGVEPAPGPGTRTTPYAIVKASCLEAVQALHALGVRRVVMLTFHGSPLHNLAIHAAVDWLWAHGTPAVAPFHSLLQLLVHPQSGLLDAAVEAVPAELRAQARADLPTDFHAGTFETSMALALAPDSVSPIHRQLPPCPPIEPDSRLVRAASLAKRLGRTALFDELRFAAYGVGWLNMRPFPGYTGRPAWASEAIGEAFTNLLIDRFAALTTAVLEGRLPRPAPILAWLPGASLGGRISTTSPLLEGDLVALEGLGDRPPESRVFRG